MNQIKYELRLTIKEDTQSLTDSIKLIETIEAKDIIQLILQLQMLILRVQRQLHEDEMTELRNMRVDDDIPF